MTDEDKPDIQTPVQERIRSMLTSIGRPALDPRHVEGYMRLDGDCAKMERKEFAATFMEAVRRCDTDSPESCEAMAKAAGL